MVHALKILVISDSHGAFRAVEDILEKNSSVKTVIFLGDGESEIEDMRNLYPDREFITVCGNCDFGSSAPTGRVAELGGHRIFCTHGHCYGVKSGDLSTLHRAAASVGCDIILYGHTHEARIDYQKGVYCVNPGSVRFSGAGPASYLELNLDGRNVVPIIVPVE